MSYRDRYVDLIRRHLGRDPKPSDGVAPEVLKKVERRLGMQLPAAVREYYLLAGRLDPINKAHNRLFTPQQLRVEDKHLWFMEENQAVAHWGLPLNRLSDDPLVHQRANADGARWYSERMRFSRFLVRLYDWQAGFADAPG
jgi:hypothetical protein